MGRPLKKDIFGTEVLGSYVNSAAGIICDFYDTELRSDGVLIKQRGAKTYVVAQVANVADSTKYATATLVSDEPNAAGEMRILGSLDGTTPGAVAIAKLTKRVATDFDGKRYTWYLDNDSSGDVLVLTAI